PHAIGLLIINILPTIVLISVALQFLRTLPASPGEPKFDIGVALKGIPYRRMRFVLAVICLLVLICVVAAQILAHTSKTWRSLTDDQIYSCYFEENARICRDYLFIKDVRKYRPCPLRAETLSSPLFAKDWRRDRSTTY